MTKLRERERAFWEEYLASLPARLRPRDAFVEANFAGDAAISDQLLSLYLSGKKYAGSSLVADYLQAGEPLPTVGRYWIVLKGDGSPGCLLRTDRVVTHKFIDVPEEIAIAEGEGDLSLEYWRKEHARFFGPFLTELGIPSLEEAAILTEFFTLVHRA